MSSNKSKLTTAKAITPETNGVEKPQDRIEFVDDNLRYGFAQMPRPVLRAKRLSLSAKAVYLMLLDYAWQNDNCFPGQDRLAADLDISRRTVIRAIDELRSYKLIDVKRQGLQKPNIYYILKLSECPNLEQNRAGSDKKSLQEVTKTRHPEVTKSHTNNTQSKDTQVNNTQYSRKARALKTENEGEGEKPKRTYSHRERGTIRNGKDTNKNNREGNNRISNSEASKSKPYVGAPLTQDDLNTRRRSGSTPTKIGDIMQGRLQAMQVQASTSSGAGKQPGRSRKPQGRSHAAPLFIQAMIAEWFSPELHDEAVTSSITRLHNLFRFYTEAVEEIAPGQFSPEQIEDKFRDLMQNARVKSKRATIKKLTEKGQPNRMPYFFACLEKSLGLKDEQENNTLKN